MFVVYDNDRKAQYPDCAVDQSWSNATFDTWEQAEAYVESWLGFFPVGGIMPLNTKVDYSGYGDYIEIREE